MDYGKLYEKMANQLGEENVHCCSICGKPMEWDDSIWINSSFGVCEECYDTITKIKLNIEEENYDEETRKFLDDLGASY